MKLILLFLFFPFILFAQNSNATKNLNFEGLFNGVWDKNQEKILWKPNFEESLSMPMDENGICHTIIEDTILSKNKLYIFFTTFDDSYFYESPSTFYPTILSIAVYELNESNNNFEILAFTKNVTEYSFRDRRDSFSLLEIGSHTFIKLTSEIRLPHHHDITSVNLCKIFNTKIQSVFGYTENEGHDDYNYDNEDFSRLYKTTKFYTDHDKTVILETKKEKHNSDNEENKVISKTREVYHISDSGEFILQCE